MAAFIAQIHLFGRVKASYNRSSSVIMKPIVSICLFSLALALFVFETAGQSRRVPPSSSDGKANSRTPTPTPTPRVDVKTDATEIATEDSDEVISVNTRLVTVPVRVLDRKGRFVGGLERSKFKVYEDGVDQEILHFSNEAQPFIVALVLDMSYSSKFKIGDIQSAAIAFIDQLRPDDQVIVIAFDEEVHMMCEATNNRSTIYRAIRNTRIATGTSLYEAVDMTMNDRLRKLEGRKAMVIFTDGVDTTSRRAHDLDNLRDALEMDALIYPIRYDTFEDVQAMKGRSTVLIPESKPQGTPPIAQQKNGVPLPMPGPMVVTPGDRGTTPEEYARGEEYLNQLANRTGGRLHVADSIENLNRAFAKIASELREFYSIGYYPRDDTGSGRTRKVKVKVDEENVAVRARVGYVLPEAKRKY